MRSRRNHLDALKSRPNRKHLPHWSIDWWINISKSIQNKEVEEEEEYNTWVSMPRRVYWGTSRRRSVTPWFTSCNAVFGSILRKKSFKLLFSFYFESFVVFLFCSRFERHPEVSLVHATHKEKTEKMNISFLPFLLVHLEGNGEFGLYFQILPFWKGRI